MSSPKSKVADAAESAVEAGKSVAAATTQATARAADEVNEQSAGAWAKASELGHRAADAVSEGYERVSDGTRHMMRQGRDAAVGWERGFEGYVKRKPILTLLAAAGVGVVVGVAVAGTRSRR